MATRTTACPGCQEAVPSGRLSCPSCGLLLASVAGGTRRRSRKTTSPAAQPADATAETAVPEPAPVEYEKGPPPVGAYVPPATSPGPFLLPARAWAGITSSAPRPMAAFGVVSARSMSTVAAGPGFARTSSPVPAAAPTITGQAPSEDLEAGWLEATAGWLMIIGSAVAILGFLLPWSRSVIGAEGTGTYFDTWGIASPSHVLVVLALAAALGLAIVANPIPTWIRTCAVGLALGGLLVGLAWPYLFGPLGAGPGVMAILIGGAMLSVAGIVDLVEGRHAQAGSDV